ncbi:MAG: hypothetical protein SGPRY_001643 [Prymnesium sp.]
MQGSPPSLTSAQRGVAQSQQDGTRGVAVRGSVCLSAARSASLQLRLQPAHPESTIRSSLRRFSRRASGCAALQPSWAGREAVMASRNLRGSIVGCSRPDIGAEGLRRRSVSVCSQGSNNSLQQVKEGEQRRSPSLWKQLCSWCHAAVKWGGRIAVTMFYVFTPPYQISFESQVSFNWLYASCYTVDALVLIDRSSSLCAHGSSGHEEASLSPPSTQCAHHSSGHEEAKKMMGSERPFELFGEATPKKKPPSRQGRRLSEAQHHLREFRETTMRKRSSRSLAALSLVLPLDALLWGGGAQHAIPFVRLTRLLYALLTAHRDFVRLERSQSVPFSLCRMLRLLSFAVFCTHCTCCAFFYFSTRPNAPHYSGAAWLNAESENPGVGSRYLRSMYWSLITFSTVGHQDVVSVDNDRGMDWEVGFAIVVMVVATFAFIYLNANCTTMIIRLNSRLETYREQLAKIDAYLVRNKVGAVADVDTHHTGKHSASLRRNSRDHGISHLSTP